MPSKIGRPRVNPNVHYADEISLWSAAEAGDGLHFNCGSPNEAINLTHRLNRARAAVRAFWPDDQLHPWDAFRVIRDRNDLCAVLVVRKQRLDLSQMSDLKGNPLNPAEFKDRQAFLPLAGPTNIANPIQRLTTNKPLKLEVKDD